MYIGEAGRRYVTRESEHIRDGKEVKDVKYTRSRKKESQGAFHKSALTDHVAQDNHTIDWEGVTLPYKEPNSDKRGILEAIAIRKEGHRTLNRDSGRHLLSEGYTNLLRPAAPPSGRKH